MPWDPSLPADNTKLRLAPAMIRANWQALETGTLPFDNVQLQEQAGDPASAANTGFLYAKQSGARTQAFYESDNGTVYQLSGLVITSAAQAAPNSGTNYGITTPWGLIMNWGTIVMVNLSVPISFAVPFATIHALTHGVRGAGAVELNASAVTNNGFTAIISVAGTISYFAIGV